MTSIDLVRPRMVPPLDPGFRPAVLARRAYRNRVERTGGRRIVLAVEQRDAVYQFDWLVSDAGDEADLFFLERTVKALLWAAGGFRVHVSAPEALTARLRALYSPGGLQGFDAEVMGPAVYGHPFEIVQAGDATLPAPRHEPVPLGGHQGGNRLAIDLGASDIKVCSIRDGEIVYTAEFPWDPKPVSDPAYHYRHVLDALKAGAARLPRVDAIGISSAGIFVANEARIASLFRGISREDFEAGIVPLFHRVRKEFGDVPLVVANDGKVAALAGALSLGVNSILGLSMGSSEAAGYVDANGAINSWLDELAFFPVDYSPDAARDEWSRDYGCGVSYFSQQAVDRLLAPAGIELPAAMPVPEKLEQVQTMMNSGDERARRIYETIGVCFGYALAAYAEFYDYRTALVMGRVTTGPGGGIIVDRARAVLAAELPELAERVTVMLPDEKSKRVGQAVAAASLPKIDRDHA